MMEFQANPKPTDPEDQVLMLLKKKYERACKKLVKVEEEVKENNKSAYKLILKHCNSNMKMKLKSTADFQ